MKRRIPLIAGGVVTGLLALLALSAVPRTTKTGYVARQGYYQLELLAGRVPLEDVAQYRTITDSEQQRLDWIPKIQSFAVDLGLTVDDHYSTINPTWDRTIWNVSASDPLAFRVERWWFPIVGTVPYLGFFSEEDADKRVAGLQARGLDVHKRTAGAYSTLGWFNDPILPGMLEWSESRLSNTLIHELAHVTLWIPGSVAFNESFASFVGDIGAERYLESTYGADSDRVRAELDRVHDRRVFRLLLTELYRDLDAVYTDDAMPDADKLAEKERLIASLPERVASSDLRRVDRWVRYVEREPWNNARLAQFRTYNKSPEHFAMLLEQEGGDLQRFFSRIEEITSGADDPYAALATAVGVDPDDE